jgi:hypothetical protein
MVIAGYATIIELAGALLSMGVKLIFTITEIIQNSDMAQEDKDVLIAKIREAQAKVPEWE